MVEYKTVVKEGYEEIHNKLVEMKDRLEEKIRQQVAEEAKTIDKMLAECTEVVEVEVDDVVEDATEEVVGE